MTDPEFMVYLLNYRAHPGWPLISRHDYIRLQKLAGTPVKDPARLPGTLAFSTKMEKLVEEIAEKIGLPPGKMGYTLKPGWDDDPLSLPRNTIEKPPKGGS